MKTCIECKVEKELTEFSRKNSSADGLRNGCKSCASIYWKKYNKDNNYNKSRTSALTDKNTVEGKIITMLYSQRQSAYHTH